ncbi:hypothetical protein COV93_08305 [Candidatus Woesearchaeota archaeon CG11_big_fil_rev_8_21_14_0_20_43_8]|nr:MAG: hypothetical protein COV93_08305 [Candidatus Woesearchaeota archaeon CG11_big_fil_rev_8_21_14_0_20_43_8]PIO04562.1 MAG: hypothetical protein COT47_08440 [Candidatus Woesearchaeota archaeon CG08_land_8_20_14_0_20_43_7]
MIDKTDFDSMLDDMQSFSEEREKVILSSREVVKISKQLIYAVHRSDMKSAEEHAKKIKEKYIEATAVAHKGHALASIGAYKVAGQEFVEAMCYLGYVKDKRILTSKELGVETEHYLLGLCDLTGELVRKAVNSGIKEDYESVLKIKELIEEMYGQFIRFDFQGGELRKKFDSIKYDLNKLENMVYELKLKGKI